MGLSSPGTLRLGSKAPVLVSSLQGPAHQPGCGAILPAAQQHGQPAHHLPLHTHLLHLPVLPEVKPPLSCEGRLGRALALPGQGPKVMFPSPPRTPPSHSLPRDCMVLRPHLSLLPSATSASWYHDRVRYPHIGAAGATGTGQDGQQEPRLRPVGVRDTPHPCSSSFPMCLSAQGGLGP